MKRAIVTGANGFVGAAVCRRLVKNGISVTAVVRSKDSALGRLNGIEGLDIVYCAMESIKELVSLVSDSHDTFYHFAWEGTSGALRGDEAVQLANVRHTCEAVKTAKLLGCEKFIFASSIMEYEIEKLFNSGKAPSISTVYCTAKKTANYMAHAIAASLDLTYLSAVISNIYGEGESSPRLINSSIRKLLNKEETSFSTGEQMYDFVYIEDAARMFAGLGEDGRNHRVYYIGSGNPQPLRFFLQEMGNQLAPGRDIGIGKMPFDGVSLTYKEFDIQAVLKDTGIKAEVSFDEGIRKTANWMKENGM
ncbi:MAG: NAD(P)-dependent oxidoreductase [Clostridium sp.]|nr:NAD(P)-dependent oxidoreductase [Clostridium sp.]